MTAKVRMPSSRRHVKEGYEVCPSKSKPLLDRTSEKCLRRISRAARNGKQGTLLLRVCESAHGGPVLKRANGAAGTMHRERSRAARDADRGNSGKVCYGKSHSSM